MTERSGKNDAGRGGVDNIFADPAEGDGASPKADGPSAGYVSAAAALRARKRAREAAQRGAGSGPAGSGAPTPKAPAARSAITAEAPKPALAPPKTSAASTPAAQPAPTPKPPAAGPSAAAPISSASPATSRPAPPSRVAPQSAPTRPDAPSDPAAAPSDPAAAPARPKAAPAGPSAADRVEPRRTPLASISPRKVPASQAKDGGAASRGAAPTAQSARPLSGVISAPAAAAPPEPQPQPKPAAGALDAGEASPSAAAEPSAAPQVIDASVEPAQAAAPAARPAPEAEAAPVAKRDPDETRLPAALPGGGGAPPASPPALAPPPAAPPSPPAAVASRYPASRSMTLGFAGVMVLVAGLFGWGAFANIAGAIIAPGQVEVETRDQVVEHPDGGVVGEILVQDGDRVEAGDILLRFDDTLLRSEESILASQYWELTAWTHRLEAEALGARSIEFDPELVALADEDPEVREMIDGQIMLHATRLRSQAEQIEQLRERQTQTREQISGAEAQIAALERQLELIAQELEGLRTLLEQGLTQLNRVLALEREEARLQGQIGELTANIAQARGQLAEIEIQIVLLSTQRQEQAMDETRRLSYEASGIREQLVAVRERLSRMDVRSPVTGTVFGNTVFAERSVVGPGEPLMFVVPEDVELIITSQIELVNIDQVFPGQPAALRFSAFSMRTTPELNGHVVRVSADAVTDEQRGISYYTAELALDPGEEAKLEGLTLLPGMPVEAYIRTDDRSPLNYLMKPLADYFSRSLREE